MSAQHGKGPRGLILKVVNGERPAGPPSWTARFGRMFPDIPEATYGKSAEESKKNLAELAEKMIAPFDPPKDGPDDEESGIPALYTYFGQFIDHDLTFDPNSSFQKEKDIDAEIDFRTPAFDLDNVYGRGPGDQPYLYDEDGKSFLLGDPLTLGSKGARDLQRNGQGRALIGDPRNDENAIVSQFQGLALRFHNRMVQENPDMDFEAIQALVRHHYQYVVVNDFLPRIVTSSVLEALQTNEVYDPAKLTQFGKQKSPFMPVEFSIAAYRLGHSMVRPGYRLNDATLVPIFPNPPGATTHMPEGLTGFRKLITDWGIDWGRFIDIDIRDYDGVKGEKGNLTREERLQFAYRIDTSLVDPLGNLPKSVAGNKPLSLAARNLIRGFDFGLPNGQAVAKALGVTPLDDEQILIGQGTTKQDPTAKSIVTISEVFKGNCPLWTYILAEAMVHMVTTNIPVKLPSGIVGPLPNQPDAAKNTTPQLGPVGGRIVAEVFLALLFSDSGSYLSMNPQWHPASGANYKLKDFVKFALGM
jgi:hypothetical protein